jgi:hypothetical protein
MCSIGAFILFAITRLGQPAEWLARIGEKSVGELDKFSGKGVTKTTTTGRERCETWSAGDRRAPVDGEPATFSGRGLH